MHLSLVFAKFGAFENPFSTAFEFEVSKEEAELMKQEQKVLSPLSSWPPGSINYDPMKSGFDRIYKRE